MNVVDSHSAKTTASIVCVRVWRKNHRGARGRCRRHDSLNSLQPMTLCSDWFFLLVFGCPQSPFCSEFRSNANILAMHQRRISRRRNIFFVAADPQHGTAAQMGKSIFSPLATFCPTQNIGTVARLATDSTEDVSLSHSASSALVTRTFSLDGMGR